MVNMTHAQFNNIASIVDHTSRFPPTVIMRALEALDALHTQLADTDQRRALECPECGEYFLRIAP